MTWSTAERIRAAAFVVLFVVMVAVPAFHLGGSGARFSWRMFSFGQALPQFTVVDDQGGTAAVDVDAFTASLRGDVPFAEALPAHLCAVVDGASSILVEADSTTTEYVCP